MGSLIIGNVKIAFTLQKILTFNATFFDCRLCESNFWPYHYRQEVNTITEKAVIKADAQLLPNQYKTSTLHCWVFSLLHWGTGWL